MYENVNLTKIYDTDEFPLGAIHDDSKGNVYEFVKYSQGSNAVAGTQGSLIYLCASGTTTVPTPTVSKDRASVTTIISTYGMARGVLMAALTDGKYGWIKKKGLTEYATPTDNSVGIGEQITSADANGQVKGVASGTAATPFLGVALKTDGGSGNSLAAGGILLNIP